MRVHLEGTDDEEEQVQRGADHRRVARAGGESVDGGGLPASRDQRADVLPLEGKVRGGLGPSEAVRLKGLEDENRRLKKLLAELMLDVAALKDLLGKN